MIRHPTEDEIERQLGHVRAMPDKANLAEAEQRALAERIAREIITGTRRAKRKPRGTT